jgi:hypothetical protein
MGMVGGTIPKIVQLFRLYWQYWHIYIYIYNYNYMYIYMWRGIKVHKWFIDLVDLILLWKGPCIPWEYHVSQGTLPRIQAVP